MKDVDLNTMARPRAYPSPSSPTIMDEETILNGIKVEIIREKRPSLVKNLNPERHFDFLRSKCVLSKQDCEEIRHEVTREKQASLFLDKLVDHGPAAYERLCESLITEKTQIFLVKMLNREFENRLKNWKMLFRPDSVQEQQLRLAVDSDSLPVPSKARKASPHDA